MAKMHRTQTEPMFIIINGLRPTISRLNLFQCVCKTVNLSTYSKTKAKNYFTQNFQLSFTTLLPIKSKRYETEYGNGQDSSTSTEVLFNDCFCCLHSNEIQLTKYYMVLWLFCTRGVNKKLTHTQSTSMICNENGCWNKINDNTQRPLRSWFDGVKNTREVRHFNNNCLWVFGVHELWTIHKRLNLCFLLFALGFVVQIHK